MTRCPRMTRPITSQSEMAINHILKAQLYKSWAFSAALPPSIEVMNVQRRPDLRPQLADHRNPREIEAQALLKAARQLQDVVENWSGPGSQLNSAIMFNRKLWSIFMSDAINDENPLAVEIRQNIANIGIFVMKQTVEIQTNPAPEKLKSLIDINCNLAAGLSGRA